MVSLPMAEKFNDVVAMDLKKISADNTWGLHLNESLENTWILHLIDVATRYTAACIIRTKQKEVVVSKIFQIWVAYFGCPTKFHSDNGGEFSNSVFTEMTEKLGVEISTTASEAPFSNGVVERHNKILYETFQKTIEEVKCDSDTALSWAVSSKNALSNNCGYCPNQLVFGYNVNLPSVLTDDLPALTSTTSSDIIRKKLNAIHAARINFVKAESSERIKRALAHNVRTYAMLKFNL